MNINIGIIDYGMGNLRNVKNALKFLGINSYISRDTRELNKADGLILPGVGAFYDAMQNLEKLEMDKFVVEQVKNNTPLLGICLGMQVLFSEGHEVKFYQGLSLLEGRVVRFTRGLKIPHMGWNKLQFHFDNRNKGDFSSDIQLFDQKSKLLRNIPLGTFVYFVHSYYVSECQGEHVIATAEYGRVFPAVVEKGNILGTQFHPEKSGDLGLKILNNYANFVREVKSNVD